MRIWYIMCQYNQSKLLFALRFGLNRFEDIFDFLYGGVILEKVYAKITAINLAIDIRFFE